MEQPFQVVLGPTTTVAPPSGRGLELWECLSLLELGSHCSLLLVVLCKTVGLVVWPASLMRLSL